MFSLQGLGSVLLCAAFLAVSPAEMAWKRLGSAHRSELQGSRHQPPPAVAICVIHKDQNEDVEEWIDYHLGLGVSKIFFFDNNSTAPIRETLSKYHDFVEYEDVSSAEAAPLNPQQFVYRKCLAHTEVPWIAFIDVDEFIVLKTKEYDSLPAFLTEFRDEGALAMNWVTFGSNGHIVRPLQHTLHAYTRCIKPHPTRTEHIKSIVNTAFAKDVSGDPHHFKYVEGKSAVNENHLPLAESPWTPGAVVSRIACHHYALKSLDEFSRKMRRGSGDGLGRKLDWFIEIDAQAGTYCAPGTNFSSVV